MAWIESHQETGRHPKTKKLARLLGVSRPAAVGHLHYLWWWALDFAQDGVLDRYDGDDIAEAMEWEGDSKTLLDALIETGYIDETDHGLMIHDWGEYAGKLMERREKDRARKRASAEKLKASREIRRSSDGTDAESAEGLPDSVVTVPNRTQPNRTVPNSTVQDSTEPNRTEQTGEDPEELEAPAVEAAPYKCIVDIYHEICVSYSRLRTISDNRKRAIAARWKEYGYDLNTFHELFSKAEASSFLKGKNDRNWSADFDWLMNSKNMAKVLEGKYVDKEPQQPPRTPMQRQQPPEKFDTMACLSGLMVDDDDLPFPLSGGGFEQ